MTFFSKLETNTRQLYNQITSSIAFYPSLIAGGFFVFTGVMLLLEQNGMSARIEEYLPFLIIKDSDVAQTLLNTLIGALISLTVFSFSMVMVMLNNAAANFSPRMLPELIADKFHQIVLGVYLGTIIFCIFLAINVTPSQPKIPLPGFSVLIGILLGIVCLIFFVFFIHSISKSVQVSYVLNSLYATTRDNMEKGSVGKLGNESLPNGVGDWHKIPSKNSGYLESVSMNYLHEICEENDLKIRVLTSEGMFVLENIPVFACSKEVDEEIAEELLNGLTFSVNELVRKDHALGFKHITEVAVKAMSPGINDPGTAISAIDYLTILFSLKLGLPESGAVKIEEESEEDSDEKTFKDIRVWLNVVTFENLFFYTLAAIRQYSKHDLIIVMKLLIMIKFLFANINCGEEHSRILARQIKIILEDAEKHLTNSADLEKVRDFVATFPQRAMA